jgi:predicted dienelactone hydrolase
MVWQSLECDNMTAINRIDMVRPDAPPLAGYGPHPVGVTTQRIVNPDQVNLLASGNGPLRYSDRVLVTEVWYPAEQGTLQGGSYRTDLRDGRQQAVLHGRAARDVPAAQGRFPLVVLSHGYPGNRFLMSHLGETLASRGYVVAAADHPGSTYADKADFGITLLHRPIDQRAIIDGMATGPLASRTDTDRVAVIGYSMGGYGALVFAGAGLSDTGLNRPGGPRIDVMSRHKAGAAEHLALVDPRVKAIVPIGPWGAQHGFWDDTALADIRVPMLVIGGGCDSVSGYHNGIRRIFDAATGCDRHLLTFDLAGHNAAAPIPAPVESWARVDWLDFIPFEHYADPVWDTVRMNNIAQHCIAGFLQSRLIGAVTGPLTELVSDAAFAPSGPVGLRLEHAGAQSD